MNYKTRKLSLKQKIMLPFSILITIICLAIALTSFLREKENLIAMGAEDAALAAKASSWDIDVDILKTLTPGCEETTEYQDLFDIMVEDKDDYGILYIYTLYEDGGNIYYGIDADESDSHNSFGTVFDYAEDAAPAFEGETIKDDVITSDDGDYCISVYMPLEDSNGDVVAVLGCDYDASSINATLKSGLVRSLALAVISVIIALILANILSSAIRRNVLIVNQKIYDLVHSDGDLTQRLDVNSGDELELIADNVNELITYIHEIMSAIAGNSKNLNGASKSAAQNMSDASRSILDVSATMEEMSAAMEETSASMDQIAQLVDSLSEEVNTISNAATDGKERSLSIVSDANKVHADASANQQAAKEKSQDMVASMQAKIEGSKAVEKIAELTNEIISISSQTNLLALNASIEAARAGEAGRGFAVVADEIGALADNSNKAAEQIKDVSQHVIDNVNALADEASRMIEFLNEVSIKGYDLVMNVSNDYSENISNMSGTLSDFADQAAKLSEELDSIKESIESITTAIDESSKGITNVAETSTTLTRSVESVTNQVNENLNIAGKLDTEVGKFKL